MRPADVGGRAMMNTQYTMFGRALQKAAGAPIGPPAVAAARFLALDLLTAVRKLWPCSSRP